MTRSGPTRTTGKPADHLFTCTHLAAFPQGTPLLPNPSLAVALSMMNRLKPGLELEKGSILDWQICRGSSKA